MENASKALLMAASVLIGIVIMSLAVYLFTYFSGSVNEMNSQLENGQVQQFNNQFTSYEAKGKNLTIYDVITVTNLAKENNAYYQLESASENNFYITVKLNNMSIEKNDDEQLKRLITIDLNNLGSTSDETTGAAIQQLKKYQCETSFNDTTGRVKEVRFY